MNNKLDKILAEISAGELIDKITILEIKKKKISDKIKLSDVEKELQSLNQTLKKFIPNKNIIISSINELMMINSKLWDLENAKRAAEKKGEFGQKFIKDARMFINLMMSVLK